MKLFILLLSKEPINILINFEITIFFKYDGHPNQKGYESLYLY